MVELACWVWYTRGADREAPDVSLTTGFVVLLRPGCADVGAIRTALSMIRGVDRVEDLAQPADREGSEPGPVSLPGNSLLASLRELLELEQAERGLGPCVL